MTHSISKEGRKALAWPDRAAEGQRAFLAASTRLHPHSRGCMHGLTDRQTDRHGKPLIRWHGSTSGKQAVIKHQPHCAPPAWRRTDYIALDLVQHVLGAWPPVSSTAQALASICALLQEGEALTHHRSCALRTVQATAGADVGLLQVIGRETRGAPAARATRALSVCLSLSVCLRRRRKAVRPGVSR